MPKTMNAFRLISSFVCVMSRLRGCRTPSSIRQTLFPSDSRGRQATRKISDVSRDGLDIRKEICKSRAAPSPANWKIASHAMTTMSSSGELSRRTAVVVVLTSMRSGSNCKAMKAVYCVAEHLERGRKDAERS